MHVLCCYKQTLLEIIGPASCPIGSSQCSEGIARMSGLSIQFVHLSQGGKLKIAECQLQEARIDDARTWMHLRTSVGHNFLGESMQSDDPVQN